MSWDAGPHKWLTSDELRNALAGTNSRYAWKAEEKLPGSVNEHVDVMGVPMDNKPIVYIEKELKGLAVFNITKIWYRLAGTHSIQPPIRLIHVFSPYFVDTGVGRTRMQEAVFLGGEAQRVTNGGIDYISIDPSYWPSNASYISVLVDQILLWV